MSESLLPDPSHGPAGPAEHLPDDDGVYRYVRFCICGRKFTSQSWDHVPAFYDHLAVNGVAVVNAERTKPR